MGGEFSTSIAFLGEQAPPGRRGLFVSWADTTGTVVSLLASGTTPLIATFLVSVVGSPLAPVIYLGLAGLISLTSALGLRETAGQPLR